MALNNTVHVLPAAPAAARFSVPTPDLPPGVAFYQVSGFARTQEAYDALTREDGWVEGTREGSRWKKRHHHDGSVVVHTPTSWSAS